jgi:hypothetical protein
MASPVKRYFLFQPRNRKLKLKNYLKFLKKLHREYVAAYYC